MKQVLIIFRIERKYIIVNKELESYNVVDRYNNIVFVGSYADCIIYANNSKAYWFFAKDTIHSTVSDMADFIIAHLLKEIDRNFAVEDDEDDDGYEALGDMTWECNEGTLHKGNEDCHCKEEKELFNDMFEVDGPLESDFSHGGMIEEP
jgi:hypothetical protein